jgi:hypothetical protein
MLHEPLEAVQLSGDMALCSCVQCVHTVEKYELLPEEEFPEEEFPEEEFPEEVFDQLVDLGVQTRDS